jgi:drug/metabolite transporter (DMT)-like permease
MFAGETLSARELIAAGMIILAVVLITLNQGSGLRQRRPAVTIVEAVEAPLTESL